MMYQKTIIKTIVNIHRKTAIAEYPMRVRKPKGLELLSSFTLSVSFFRDVDTLSCLELIISITLLSFCRSFPISTACDLKRAMSSTISSLTFSSCSSFYSAYTLIFPNYFILCSLYSYFLALALISSMS